MRSASSGRRLAHDQADLAERGTARSPSTLDLGSGSRCSTSTAPSRSSARGGPRSWCRCSSRPSPPLPGETEDDLRRLVLDDIMRLNGKQTIYQMIQLADRVRERGGIPEDPLAYKHEYLRRLALTVRGQDRRPSRRLDRPRRPPRPRLASPARTPHRREASASTWPAAPTSTPSRARPTCSTSPATSARTSTAPSTTTKTSPRR